MSNRTKSNSLRTAILVGALALSQAAFAGRVVLDNDEWTFTYVGFGVASSSTTALAQNLASFMNVDGGSCNLLIYSSNFGLTQSYLNTALTGAGCSVSYSTGAFDLATLSGFDGVFLGGAQYGYDAATLTSYVNSGHSVYIAGGTGTVAHEDTADRSIRPDLNVRATHRLGHRVGERRRATLDHHTAAARSRIDCGVQ